MSAYKKHIVMAEYRLKTGRTGDAVIRAWRRLETGVVRAYRKIETRFVETFLERID